MISNPLDLDLPKRLAAPDGAALRIRLGQSLGQAHAELLTTVRSGLSRSEFTTEYLLLDAVTAAREVLDAFTCPTADVA